MTNNRKNKIHFLEISQLHKIRDQSQDSVVFILPRTIIKANVQFTPFLIVSDNVNQSKSWELKMQNCLPLLQQCFHGRHGNACDPLEQFHPNGHERNSQCQDHTHSKKWNNKYHLAHLIQNKAFPCFGHNLHQKYNFAQNEEYYLYYEI